MDEEAVETDLPIKKDVDLRRWHIVKGVSLPTIILLAGQTSALVWYAAQFSFEQRAQAVKLSAVEVKVDRLVETTNSSIGPAAVMAAKMIAMESQIGQLQIRYEALRDAATRATRLDGR